MMRIWNCLEVHCIATTVKIIAPTVFTSYFPHWNLCQWNSALAIALLLSPNAIITSTNIHFVLRCIFDGALLVLLLGLLFVRDVNCKVTNIRLHAPENRVRSIRLDHCMTENVAKKTFHNSVFCHKFPPSATVTTHKPCDPVLNSAAARQRKNLRRPPLPVVVPLT